MSNLRTDARPVPGLDDGVNRQYLITVDKGIGKKDLCKLKFLCTGLICTSSLERCTTALHLFERLEEGGYLLPSSDVSIVSELLAHIRREDLRRPSERVGERPRINPYRVLLFRICQEVGKDDLKRLKYACTDHLTVRDSQKIDDMEGLFLYLERRDLVNESNLTYVDQILTAVGAMKALTILRSHRSEGIGQSNLSPHVHISAAAAANDVRLPSTTFQAVQETVRSPSSALTSARAEKMALQNFSESSHQFNNANLQSSTVSHSSMSRNTPATPQLNSRFSSGNLLPDVNIPMTMTPAELEQGPLSFVRNRYKMSSIPRGYAIIINNREFSPTSDLGHRLGSEKDEKSLSTLFTRLGFEVRLYCNCPVREMHRIFIEYSDKCNRQADKIDCLICCIMSHGFAGGIYGSDGQPMSIDEAEDYFNSQRCPGLIEKPKVFLISACQTNPDPEETVRLSMSNKSTKSSNSYKSNRGDFVTVYATVPGCFAFRDTSKGTWFIMCLVEALRKYSADHEFTAILTHVNNKIVELSKSSSAEEAKLQTSEYKSTLSGSLYLSPITGPIKNKLL